MHGQRLRVSRGIRITGRVWLYNSHQIKGKGKSTIKEGIPKYRARRWVVEKPILDEQIQTIAGKMGKED